jgi:hypothetical protein
MNRQAALWFYIGWWRAFIRGHSNFGRVAKGTITAEEQYKKALWDAVHK